MLILGSSTELVPGLVRLGITLLVLSAIAGVSLWLARRRGSRTVTMDVALTLSGWWVAISLLSTGITIVNTLTGAVAVTSGASIDIDWPNSVPCDAFGDRSRPALLCGSGELDAVSVTGASLGIRVLAALGHLSTAAIGILPAALLGAICFLTLSGRPFGRAVTSSLLVASAAMLVLGVAAGILPEISGVLALREALPPESEWYPEVFHFDVPLLPVGGALALAALAGVFREGARLQRDRERLELENAQLQHETEGLV